LYFLYVYMYSLDEKVTARKLYVHDIVPIVCFIGSLAQNKQVHLPNLASCLIYMYTYMIMY